MADSLLSASTRMSWAMEHRGIGLKKLSRELKAGSREVPNSVGQIRNYLGGKAEPGVEFLVTVARICEVRSEWLVLGLGPRTVEEAIVNEERARGPGYHMGEKIRLAIAKKFPRFLELRGAEVGIAYEAIFAVQRYRAQARRAAGGENSATAPERIEIAAELGRFLERGASLPGQIHDERAMRRYVGGACLALMSLSSTEADYRPDASE